MMGYRIASMYGQDKMVGSIYTHNKGTWIFNILMNNDHFVFNVVQVVSGYFKAIKTGNADDLKYDNQYRFISKRYQPFTVPTESTAESCSPEGLSNPFELQLEILAPQQTIITATQQMKYDIYKLLNSPMEWHKFVGIVSRFTEIISRSLSHAKYMVLLNMDGMILEPAGDYKIKINYDHAVSVLQTKISKGSPSDKILSSSNTDTDAKFRETTNTKNTDEEKKDVHCDEKTRNARHRFGCDCHKKKLLFECRNGLSSYSVSCDRLMYEMKMTVSGYEYFRYAHLLSKPFVTGPSELLCQLEQYYKTK